MNSASPILNEKTPSRQIIRAQTQCLVSGALRHQEKLTRFLRSAELQSSGRKREAIRLLLATESLVASVLRRLTCAEVG